MRTTLCPDQTSRGWIIRRETSRSMLRVWFLSLLSMLNRPEMSLSPNGIELNTEYKLSVARGIPKSERRRNRAPGFLRGLRGPAARSANLRERRVCATERVCARIVCACLRFKARFTQFVRLWSFENVAMLLGYSTNYLFQTRKNLKESKIPIYIHIHCV